MTDLELTPTTRVNHKIIKKIKSSFATKN
jgi:5'-AMP-activated protein kinase catalytic alpha subunit